MKIAVLVSVLAVTGIFSTCNAPLSDLNGTWTGKVTGYGAPGFASPPKDYEFWITIQGDRADLWVRGERGWARPWKGVERFKAGRHKSNIVLYASNSKPSVSCHWVETWTLTMSQFEPGSMETLFQRIVNNTGCPVMDGKRMQFAHGATGRLRRVSTERVDPKPVATD